MKCHDLDTNALAVANVLADGVICAEYNVELTGRDLQCWIPVAAGQELTLECAAALSSLRYQIDLIVDGVLRDTKTSGRKANEWRNARFNTACSGTKSPSKRGKMKIVSIQSSGYFLRLLGSGFVADQIQLAPVQQLAGQGHVGTLEVRIYKSDTNSAVHRPGIKSLFEIESWRDLAGGQGTSQIKPMYEIQ